MKNKILIGAVILLAAALIFENAYLLGRYKRQETQKFSEKQCFSPSAKRMPSANLRTMHSWDPFAEMNRMQERMNYAFEDNFSKASGSSNIHHGKMLTSSQISFNTTESAYVVKVAMGGIDKDAIKIEVKDRELIISTEDKKDQTAKDKNSYAREISYGNFISKLMLPQDAQIESITSDYKDGILTVTIPKKEAEKISQPPPIKVPVK